MQGFGIGNVLRTSMRVWQQNFIPFSLLAILMYTPSLVLRLVAPTLAEELVMVPFGTVVDTLAAAAATYGVIMELHGTRPSHRECVRRGLAQLGPMLGLGLVTGLAITGGLFLAVVPGIIVSLMLWVVVPVAVIERPGVMASLRRSRELTHGYKRKLLVIAVVLVVVSLAAEATLDDVVDANALPFVQFAVDALTGLFGAIIAAVTYTQLRQVKEGAQLPQLAQAFVVVRHAR